MIAFYLRTLIKTASYVKLRNNMSQMCGPTGIGFLYGKGDILSSMPPFLGIMLFHLKLGSVISRNLIFKFWVLKSLDLESMRMVFFLFSGGGEMISDVFLDHSTYAEPPSRFVNLSSCCHL